MAEVVSSHVQLTCTHHCDAPYGHEARHLWFEDYKFSKASPEVKEKESEGTAPEVIEFTKPGSGKANIELRDSILHGGTLPVVKLDKIHSTEGGEDMPPPDAPGPITPTYAPDEETRAAAEVLKTLQKQQPTASFPKSSSLSAAPGEADYFEGGGLIRTIQESLRRWKMCSTPVSQLPTPNTPAGLISTVTVGILPPARVLAEDLTKATLREESPNLLQMALKCVGKQTACESTDSHSAGEQGGTKDNLVSSSKPRVLTAHSSAPGSNGSAAGGCGQDPNELRQKSPIWPWLSPMMMSLLMTHTRLYLLRMPSLFLSFQDRILKGLTGVTFY